MKFVSSFEKKMLFNYLKQNIEWLCLEPSKKKCLCWCWLYHLFDELKFIINENKFFSCVERYAFVERFNKKIQKKSTLMIFSTEKLLKQ